MHGDMDLLIIEYIITMHGDMDLLIIEYIITTLKLLLF